MFDGEGYFEWLWERSGLGPEYSKLLTLLYETTYVPTLVDDENRREDGDALLRQYCREYGYDIPPVDEGISDKCSVLEMLIAFATRINTELVGDPSGSYVGLWLARMLENLGIYKYDDAHWSRIKVARKVWIWMHKKGDVALFPITLFSDLEQDSRKISEWERVNMFLNAQFS